LNREVEKMSIDQAEKPRSHSGRFQKGHPGYKPKGAKNKMTKNNREAMIQAATELGGKAGLVGYYKANPKLLNEGLIEILPSRSKAATVDAAGNPVDISESGKMICPGIDNLNIIGIPPGWVVTGLYDFEAHMPRELLYKLRTVLPRDAFTPLRDPEFELPPPIDDTPPDNIRPMLKVFDRVDDDSEPSPAA
jgi:hypothetical protein